MRPIIAIVGSADRNRQSELGLVDVDRASGACEALGRELAEQGFDIIVYSSDPQFIEASVVSGYIGSGKAEKNSIQVRHPENYEHDTFAEMQQHPEYFDVQVDVDEGWEVSFYRSLYGVDGMLLIGGGQSTLITGLIAVTFRKPVVAIAAFGGAARKVRQTIARSDTDATEQHVNAMGRAWHDGSAAELVAALIEQRSHRARIEADQRRADAQAARRRLISLGAGALLLVLALAAIPVVRETDPGSPENVVALFLAPMLAGVFGAIVRTALDDGTAWMQAALLGLGAGVLAALLFVASQLATSPDALEQDGVNTLVVFMLLVGAVAGLTFDAVYGKLRQEDVVDTTALDRS